MVEPEKLPRFWLGLCLLIWGYAVDQIALAITLAVISEIGVFLPFKWALTEKHFYRVADASSALFAILAVYQFNEHSIYGIYRILSLLPLCIFPLLLVERYSTRGALPLSALFLSLRRRVRSGFDEERYVGTEYLFVLVCVLSASAGDIPTLLYLGLAFFIVVGTLLVKRVQRYSFPVWGTTIAAAALVAIAIHSGFGLARAEIEDTLSYWVNQFAWFQTDPTRELTSIGSIGRLKLSDRIRVRIKIPLSTPLPIMLHEASYSKYNLGSWSSKNSQFTVVDPVPGSSNWMLDNDPGDGALRSAKIIVKHPKDVAVVPLPYGTVKIFGSEVIEVQRNQFGTTLIEALPGQFEYGVAWNTRSDKRAPPTSDDLAVPDNYKQLVRQVADEIGLERADSKAAIEKVVGFFQASFKYSLIQKGFYPGRTPLSHFMLHERRGHCEYFATATALLLRHVGIPTRYAVGYVVDEYSPLEKAFIARARHAHSWTEVFVDNRWTAVDTTSGEWYELEHANASNWQQVQDIWSWVTNQYARFQRSDVEIVSDSLIWLVPPLIVLLLWRLRSHLRNTGEQPAGPRPLRGARGQDSELYRLSQLVRDKGFTLQSGDTLRSFLVRNVQPTFSGVELTRLLQLHYQYRFSVSGLSLSERDELSAGSAIYCHRYETRE